MKKYRFAVAGSGRIARKFIGGLPLVESAIFVGAASKNLSRASVLTEEFRDVYPDAKAYASYEELAADPNVDVVYVSNLNPQHEETAILFLNAGKAVICEKPFALNTKSAAKMVEAARKNQVFLMEAMWTRFLPVSRRVREWIDAGQIGEIISADCAFGMDLMRTAEDRTAVPEKGGGALLDLGIYPISYFSWLFRDPPKSFLSSAALSDTGVDASFEAIFHYGEKRASLSFIPRTAHVTAAIDRNLTNEMTIIGTEGMIRVHAFWMSDKASLYKKAPDSWGFDLLEETYAPDFVGTGYQYEAQEVIRMLESGQKESSIIPLSETLSILETMDALRKEWGIVFPQERI